MDLDVCDDFKLNLNYYMERYDFRVKILLLK